MAQISIGDLTGVSQVDVSDNSLLGKNQFQALKSATRELVAALPEPVADSKFHDATFAATFENPLIPLKANIVGIKAGVNSTLTLYNASDTPLFGEDDYDAIDIADGEYWISFELDAVLDASITATLPYGFGVTFGASKAASFASYVFIPSDTAAANKLQQTVADALSRFNMLNSPEDVLGIPPNTTCTCDLSGTVKIGGSWSLPISVNQLSLADANLPFNQSVSVSPALAVQAGGEISLTSEFNVRVHRVDPNTILLGLYKKHGTEFDVTFTASAGLAAYAGNTDLIDAFFTAVAPGIDQGGLTDTDLDNIQTVLSDSIDRSLSLSLNAACSASSSNEAAIIYRIDTSTGDSATKDALSSALRGDWTLLSALKNAKEIRNVVTHTVEKQFSLTVNILGIYNYSSVSDFIRSLRVIHNREDGSVILTDSVTASRITTVSTPLAADGDKLRAALYEGFVATATYKALLAGSGAAPTFGAQQDFLLYHNRLSYRDALKQLNVGEVLGIMPSAVKARLSAVGSSVHQARFAATSVYSNDDVMRFFFSDIHSLTSRGRADVQRIGRQVLAGLLDPQDSVDSARISVLLDDRKWSEMDANPAQIRPPYSGDWYDVTTWADAIVKVGPLLAAAIQSARSVVGDPSRDPAFMKHRSALAHALDGVTHKTRAAFEHGFAICVMTTLCGGRPSGAAPTFEARWDSKTVFSNSADSAASGASPIAMTRVGVG